MINLCSFSHNRSIPESVRYVIRPVSSKNIVYIFCNSWQVDLWLYSATYSAWYLSLWISCIAISTSGLSFCTKNNNSLQFGSLSELSCQLSSLHCFIVFSLLKKGFSLSKGGFLEKTKQMNSLSSTFFPKKMIFCSIASHHSLWLLHMIWRLIRSIY